MRRSIGVDLSRKSRSRARLDKERSVFYAFLIYALSYKAATQVQVVFQGGKKESGEDPCPTIGTRESRLKPLAKELINHIIYNIHFSGGRMDRIG